MTHDDYIAIAMYNILAKIGKNKQVWRGLGYGKESMSIEEIVNTVLKQLAENGCGVAITGKAK